jgi:hypothetical protein
MRQRAEGEGGSKGREDLFATNNDLLRGLSALKFKKIEFRSRVQTHLGCHLRLAGSGAEDGGHRLVMQTHRSISSSIRMESLHFEGTSRDVNRDLPNQSTGQSITHSRRGEGGRGETDGEYDQRVVRELLVHISCDCKSEKIRQTSH